MMASVIFRQQALGLQLRIRALDYRKLRGHNALPLVSIAEQHPLVAQLPGATTSLHEHLGQHCVSVVALGANDLAYISNSNEVLHCSNNLLLPGLDRRYRSCAKGTSSFHDLHAIVC